MLGLRVSEIYRSTRAAGHGYYGGRSPQWPGGGFNSNCEGLSIIMMFPACQFNLKSGEPRLPVIIGFRGSEPGTARPPRQAACHGYGTQAAAAITESRRRDVTVRRAGPEAAQAGCRVLVLTEYSG